MNVPTMSCNPGIGFERESCNAMKVFLVPNYYKQEAVESGLMLEL